MPNLAKELRSLYLKGILPGHETTIELVESIKGRNDQEQYVTIVEKGALIQATMTTTCWHVKIHDHSKLETVEMDIPFKQGRVRDIVRKNK